MASELSARKVNGYLILASAITVGICYAVGFQLPTGFSAASAAVPTSYLAKIVGSISAVTAISCIILVYVVSWGQLIQHWRKRKTGVNLLLVGVLIIANIIGSVLLWLADPLLVRSENYQPINT